MDGGNPTKLTRQELYERLWKMPATKVARELGITDVAMIYLCRNYEIPKPPKGYWTMLAHGRQLERPPLPELIDQAKQTVEISPERVKMITSEMASAATVVASNAVATPPTPKIVVPDTLRSPHPLVDRTNQALRESEPNTDGLIRPKWTKCLNVTVGRQEIGRAMRLLDTLCKTAISRGMTVRVEEEDQRTITILSVEGADLKLRLSEMLGQREKKLSAAEKKRYEGYSPEMARWYLFEKHPRGEFSFSLEGKFGASKNWSEKDGKRLEERLESILSTAVRMAERVREDQKHFDECQRQRQEEARLRQEAEERHRVQERLRLQLDEQIVRWERAETIRKFVTAARAKAGDLAAAESSLGKWLAWADGYANWIDSLREPIAELPNRRRKDSLPYNHTPALDP